MRPGCAGKYKLRDHVHAELSWTTPRSAKTTSENPQAWQKRKDAGKVSTPPLGMQVQHNQSHRKHRHMKQPLYAIFTRQGYDRIVKTEPDPSRGEYVIKIILHVPDEVFDKQPVPVVEVSLTPRQIQTADVTVDGVDVPQPVDAVARKQRTVQQQLALLYEAARNSPDKEMQEVAQTALSALLEADVDVRIVEASE